MVTVLSDKEFKGFRQMIFDAAGIHMSDVKKPLVSGRLAKRLGLHGLDSYDDYLALVRRDPAERQMAIDLLTTNETYFFREPKHFDFLAHTLVPAWRARGQTVRIWSGACSTGEEPYTISMVLSETLGHPRFEILASDISSRVLTTAEQALYPLEDAKNIPKALRQRHCLKGIGRHEGWFLVDRPVREHVQFESINLCAPLPDIGPFDAIFLRNVMIYFAMDTKREVVNRLLPLLKPGGHLFVSHSESLHGVTDALQMVKPSVYCRRAD